jgi:hypothetical protein
MVEVFIENYKMKKYIFITTEGTTFSPNGNEIENMQVIGIVENVSDENEAYKKLLMENDWIIDSEFNVAEFICYEIL